MLENQGHGIRALMPAHEALDRHVLVGAQVSAPETGGIDLPFRSDKLLVRGRRRRFLRLFIALVRMRMKLLVAVENLLDGIALVGMDVFLIRVLADQLLFIAVAFIRMGMLLYPAIWY